MEKTFSIQQTVTITKLSAHTLRYYERIGLLQPGRHHSSGYRCYTEQDVNVINFIKRLRATGMPIRDILCYIDLARQGDSTVLARLELLEQHRQHVETAQHEITQHLAAITAKIEYYKSSRAYGIDTVTPFPACSEEESYEKDITQENRQHETSSSRT